MAVLAVRIALVHREPNVVIFEGSVTGDSEIYAPIARWTRARRCEERVTAF
jgi:hypothetical protein